MGKDAVGFADGRRRISDEEWVAMGGDLSDAEYNKKIAELLRHRASLSAPGAAAERDLARQARRAITKPS